MKEFNRKRAVALKILAQTGISKRNYAPPTFEWLWRIGVNLPPPHFLSTFSCTLIMGGPFGVSALGLLMADIGRPELEVATPLVLGVTALIGSIISFYYRVGRRRHRLPDWADL